MANIVIQAVEVHGAIGDFNGAEVTLADGTKWGVWFKMDQAAYSGATIKDGAIRNRQKQKANRMSAVRSTAGAWGASFDLRFGAYMRSAAGKAAMAVYTNANKAADDFEAAYDAAHMEKHRVETAAFAMRTALQKVLTITTDPDVRTVVALALLDDEGNPL